MPNLIRRNPFDDVALRPRSLFGHDLFGWLRPEGPFAMEWDPRCDVTEKDGTLLLHAELPGVKREDMTVTVEGTQLVVRGEKRNETKGEEKGHSYSERFFGSFERRIAIPAGIDESQIAAELKDGVLEVRVPLPAATPSEAKTIEIKAG